MEKELVDAAVNSNLFENLEQWDSFLTLVRLKDEIEKKLYLTLVEKLKTLELNGRWSCYVPKEGKGEIHWYLNEFSTESLKICLERDYFSLKIPDDRTEKFKIMGEINSTPQYKAIFDSFKHPLPSGEIAGANDVIIREQGFEFEKSKGKVIHPQLAWFAGNETKEYVEQVQSKLEPFFENKLTEALTELNRKYYPKS